MTRSRYLTLCALVLTGAFAGGFAANRAIPVVHAQMPGATDVKSSSFILTDARNNPQGTLRSTSTGAELTLNDAAGNTRVEISASGGIVIRDAKGRLTWRSPKTGLLPTTE